MAEILEIQDWILWKIGSKQTNKGSGEILSDQHDDFNFPLKINIIQG